MNSANRLQVLPAGRVQFVDVFRGAFALLMLQGHTFRALLDSSFKSGKAYEFHELIHGLTGPAFLFASGASFAIATIPRWDQHRSWNSKTKRRVLRFCSLLIIGYMLHLTYFSLRRTILESTPEQMAYLASMDILQCIGISGLLLQTLVRVLPNRHWFFSVSAAGALTIGLSTQVVWGFSQGLPLWLRMSLSGAWGSVYPLFPHLGFYLAGAAAGYLYLEYLQPQQNRALQWLQTAHPWLTIACVALFLLPLVGFSTGFWTVGPGYFLPRLGILGAMVLLFARAESRLSGHFSVIALVGRESLLAYTVHLLMLYGSALNPNMNLTKWLGDNCGFGTTAGVLAGLMMAMIVCCWSWMQLKRHDAGKAKGLQAGLAAYVAFAFFTG
jgi:uncharacterized membrane protein